MFFSFSFTLYLLCEGEELASRLTASQVNMMNSHKEPKSKMTTTEPKLHDIVRISNGQQLIITGFNPRFPANKYSGILVNGQGKPYKFGPKHQPTVIGHASADHPALKANAARNTARTSTKPDRTTIDTHVNTLTRLIDGNGSEDLSAVLTPIINFLLEL